jgi:hypothetical protein
MREDDLSASSKPYELWIEDHAEETSRVFALLENYPQPRQESRLLGEARTAH